MPIYAQLNVGETKKYSGYPEGGNALSIRNLNQNGVGQVTIPMDQNPAHNEVCNVNSNETKICHMNDDREGVIINTGHVDLEFAVIQ